MGDGNVTAKRHRSNQIYFVTGQKRPGKADNLAEAQQINLSKNLVNL